MNIIIVGCGKNGSELAEQLCHEGHDITIIDTNERVLNSISNSLDVMTICGNGAMREIQLMAGVKSADVIIAVTGSDELNMLCCLLAKKEGDICTIAGIRNPEYEAEVDYLKKALNLSLVINPEKIAAREIVHLLRFPFADEVETFSNGKVDMISFTLPEDSPISGIALRDLQKSVKADILISAILRGDEVIIPSGDTVLMPKDRISVIATPNDVVAFCKECRMPYQEDRSAMLIGGGKIAHYVAERMRSQKNRCKLKVIEKNEQRCLFLQEEFPNVSVIHGDGTNQQLLIEEGLENTDAIVTLTGIDEENIVAGIMAGNNTKARCITKVQYFDTKQLRGLPGVGSVVCPKEVTAEQVVRFVRGLDKVKGSEMESFYKVADGKAEAAEFIVDDNPRLVGIPFSNLDMKKNMLVAAIIRGSHVIKPGGSDCLNAGDHAVIISTGSQIRKLSDVLR